MFAVCIESSHQRGMGHFYRALVILEYLKEKKEEAILIINDDLVSMQILEKRKIKYETADYTDVSNNWERRLIRKYQIDVWFLDKFETGRELAEHVKRENVVLAAIDDCGAGAELVDLHFCAMFFQNCKGKYIYQGKEYLILNPEIAQYRRKRTELKKVLVSLGGSDTYGVTVKVVRMLKEKGYAADVIIGPNFCHKESLWQEIDEKFVVYDTVPSLIAKFSEYDLAITGGGVTCFEANASGLPCIIIANEVHEMETGKYLAGFGGAEFLGYYKDISENDIDITRMDIRKMSEKALNAVSLNGMDNIYKVITSFTKEKKRDEE